jgi:hypothetical protein
LTPTHGTHVELESLRSSGVDRRCGWTGRSRTLDRMVEIGLRVAVVGTSGDPGHAPARRAYANVGFNTGIPSIWLGCDLSERRSGRV